MTRFEFEILNRRSFARIVAAVEAAAQDANPVARDRTRKSNARGSQMVERREARRMAAERKAAFLNSGFSR